MIRIKKGYGLLIIWSIIFVAVDIAVCFLPIDGDLIMRLTNNILTIALTILMLLIYVTERVYWFNNITYEEAVAMGSSRRKNYAKKVLLAFGILAGVFLIFSIVMGILHLSYWIDFVVMCVGILVVTIAFCMMKY